MAKEFSLSLDDFNYAAEQIQLPLKNRFGDMDWERRLTVQNNNLYRYAIRVSGLELYNAPTLINFTVRRTLTLVFGSIFHALDKQLPRMTFGEWKGIAHSFSKPKVKEPSLSLMARSEELLRSINPWIAHIWTQAMDRDVRRGVNATDGQMSFASALVLHLVANLLEEPYFRLLSDNSISQSKPTSPPREKRSNKPIVIGDTGITSRVSDVTFDDIGGCHESKEELRKLVQRMANPEVVNRWGGRLPKAVLLQGPHGTGKTMLVNAFANAMDLPFFVARLSDILSYWVNQTPDRLRNVIDNLCKSGGVLALNEADALLVQRGTSNAHHEDEKLVNEWNISIDLIRPEHRAIIFLTTNFTEKLDLAAIRDGRVDRILKIGMPTAEDRKEVFGVHIARIERLAGWRVFQSNLPMDELARLTDGLNPAAIEAILLRASDLKIDEELAGGQPALVTAEDLFRAIAVRKAERDDRKNQPIGFLR